MSEHPVQTAETQLSPEPQPDGEQFFRGTVARLTFFSDESGFSVLKVDPEPGMEVELFSPGQTITVVGSAPAKISPGESIIARGTWHEHPKFGRQFRARSITQTAPTSQAAILSYLASGAVKGFGPVLAERVVRRFGEKTLDVLDSTPGRLREVPGIGEKKLTEIVAAWQEKQNFREVLLFFQTHNISLSLAKRIYDRYGDRAVERVSENPYILASEMWGVGFLTADKVARALGISDTSPERIIAGLSYVLQRAADDGHCYLPRAELLSRTETLLSISDEQLLLGGLNQAVLRADLIGEAERIYPPRLYQSETELAKLVSRRLKQTAREISERVLQGVLETPLASLDRRSDNVTPKMIRLSHQQKDALKVAAESSLMVITGGPGCGKTTVVRAISQLFRRAGLRVQLAAPTGRAAQRLSELCSMSASTIHRLLRYDPQSHQFVHNAEEPLALDALIVDESSMIDLELAQSLLGAVPPHARVVFVGDADQLPSVGPGLFLADLLAVQQVPRVQLTELFRRADESAITHLAHKINSARVPDIPSPDGETKTDAYFLRASGPQEAASLVERLVVEQVPKKFGLSARDILLLTPMNKGPLGAVALNRQLQGRLVPERPGLPQVTVGELEFRLGDRICQRVNNYNIHPQGVFNGDRGEIIGIDDQARCVYVRLWDGREVEYKEGALRELDLAYALTIHRSQGSEAPAVVLILHDSHHIMLERQLLYTAVTRAKRLLVIVGTRKALVLATKRNRSRRRFTTLAERIEKLLG